MLQKSPKSVWPLHEQRPQTLKHQKIAEKEIMKPTVFIGSTSEGKLLVDAMVKHLELLATPKPWNEGVFQVSEIQQESLLKCLKSCDYAIIILTGDDGTISRGKDYLSPRDNLIFEAGLGFGLLGPNRTFLIPEDTANLKIPSDLNGFNLAPCLDLSKMPDAIAATKTTADQIISCIQTTGTRPLLQIEGGKGDLARMAIDLLDSAEHSIVMFGGDLSWAEEYEDVLRKKIRKNVCVEIFGEKRKGAVVRKNTKLLRDIGARVYLVDQSIGLKLSIIDHESKSTSRFMVSFKNRRTPIGARKHSDGTDISYAFHIHEAESSPVVWASVVSQYEILRRSNKSSTRSKFNKPPQKRR